MIGAALFHWLDSIFFVVITLTTIGYGDFSPTTPMTKLITIFFGLNGVIMLFMLFDAMHTLRGWDLSASSSEEEKS